MYRSIASNTARSNGSRRLFSAPAFIAIALTLAALANVTGCMAPTSMIPEDLERPADSEFGTGPRTSARGLYTATLGLNGTLTVGPMHRMTLNIATPDGAPVDSLAVTVGGGMPEHGHGLPTTPRATRQTGAGAYQIDGVRFNMGGWWVLAFELVGPSGRDTITFNVEL